ncbi:2-amino-4-hydroxy-6-hydroxymethyldihydropteridine diphosphokinase [Candidatus Latescibacterota bacterium]
MGSNIGDRFDYLCRAIGLLNEPPGIVVSAVSPVYETAPVGPPQGDYLNAAVAVVTRLTPGELFARCRHVEVQCGRQRRERWGPREIDIDVLLFGVLVIEEGSLVIPHPHMTERGFVLYPLGDIAPDVVHPVLKRTIRELRDHIGAEGISRREDLVLDECLQHKSDTTREA